ncbi:MAG: hypothetical protein OXF25_09045 [Cyanobacteria bacterium MAG CAR3_bin_5]|nr:hypothetical protein [Cyanobacteria bacterium MAG CAR3_bin_5]
MTSKPPSARLSDKPLKDLTVAELKDLCRDQGIKGYAHKPKARLLEMVEADGSGIPARSAADESTADAPSQPKPGRAGLKKTSKARKTSSSPKQAKGEQGDLASLTIVQLKQLCKDQGVKGFARKTKQQLLDLINSSTVATESSDGQSEADVEQEKDHDQPSIDNAPMDGPDSDRFYSEDLDTSQITQEEPNDELPSAELDVVKENFEDQFDGNGEDAVVEVSDRLIFEVLDRFDRIEALLQRIAGSVDRP